MTIKFTKPPSALPSSHFSLLNLATYYYFKIIEQLLPIPDTRRILNLVPVATMYMIVLLQRINFSKFTRTHAFYRGHKLELLVRTGRYMYLTEF